MSNLVDKFDNKDRKEFKGPFNFCPLCGGEYEDNPRSSAFGVCISCKVSHFKAAQKYVNFYASFVPGEYQFI